jgi:hypothetical protein
VDSELAGEDRIGGSLDVVGRDDADEVAPTGRVVAGGLSWCGARTGMRQADVGIRGADGDERAAWRSVENRYFFDRRAG